MPDKTKANTRFDGKTAQPVIHAIYPTLSIRKYTKSLALLLITKLRQHPMILGCPWIKKYGVLLDMINDFITFFPGYCTHLRASLFLIFPKPEETKTIFEVRQQNIFLNHILKRGLDKNLDDFLRITQKISNKKKQLINASKQKQSINKQKLEIVVISSLDNFSIENLPIPI